MDNFTCNDQSTHLLSSETLAGDGETAAELKYQRCHCLSIQKTDILQSDIPSPAIISVRTTTLNSSLYHENCITAIFPHKCLRILPIN